MRPLTGSSLGGQQRNCFSSAPEQSQPDLTAWSGRKWNFRTCPALVLRHLVGSPYLLLSSIQTLQIPREGPALPQWRKAGEPDICLLRSYSGNGPVLKSPVSLWAVPLTLQICKLPCEAAVALLQGPVLLVQEVVAFPQLLQLFCRGQAERWDPREEAQMTSPQFSSLEIWLWKTEVSFSRDRWDTPCRGLEDGARKVSSCNGSLSSQCAAHLFNFPEDWPWVSIFKTSTKRAGVGGWRWQGK